MHSSRLRIRAIALLCMATASGAVIAQDAGFTPPPARVETAVAEMRDMAPTVDVSGTVVSLNDARIASEVEGVLTSLAEVGAGVDAGDTIARIDPRLLQIAVRRADANAARLATDFEYRQRQLERTEELAAKASASKTLLDEARAQRDQARHALDDAQAALERAQADLERTVIRAPFSGHVTQRLSAVGEYVNIGEDVLRLVDTHRIEIALPASIQLAPFIKRGMRVSVSGDGIIRQEEVRTVVPVGDAVSRMVEVRLRATGSDWLVGMPVQVSLPSRDAVSTVAVPRDALVERDGRRFIYKVVEGKAEQVAVRPVAIVGLWVGIPDGITAGEEVIVRGAERLSPGQAVSVISRSATAAASN